MAFRLILSDLGGVVVECETDRIMHHVAQLIGRSFDEVQEAVYDRELLFAFELGKLNAQGYYEGLRGKLTLPWTYEQFVRSWNDMIREKPEVTRLLPALRKTCRLMALTNTNELHLNYIKTGVRSLAVFDDWIASCDVGVRKPDPAIYQLALHRADVPARDTVYIDDRPELVEAGRAMGLTAIRFESAEQLAGELRRLGLNL